MTNVPQWPGWLEWENGVIEQQNNSENTQQEIFTGIQARSQLRASDILRKNSWYRQNLSTSHLTDIKSVENPIRLFESALFAFKDIQNPQEDDMRNIISMFDQYGPLISSLQIFQAIKKTENAICENTEFSQIFRRFATMYCNNKKMDGGVVIMNYGPGTYAYFGEKALQMRMAMEEINYTIQTIFIHRERQAKVHAGKVIVFLYQQYEKLWVWLNNLELFQCVVTTLASLWSTPQKEYIIEQMEFSCRVFCTSRSQDSSLDISSRYIGMKNLIIWMQKIQDNITVNISPDNMNADINRKLCNIVITEKIRDVANLNLIKFKTDKDPIWILIKKIQNPNKITWVEFSYRFVLFNQEPEEYIMEKYKKDVDNRLLWHNSNWDWEKCIIDQIDNFWSTYIELPPQIQLLLHSYPKAAVNILAITKLALISITCPETIIKQAYELCGLNYHHHQYRRESGVNPHNFNSESLGSEWKPEATATIVRYYPYLGRHLKDSSGSSSIRHLAESERQINKSWGVIHKVLLRTRQNKDGTIKSYQPSPQYIEIAKSLWFTLNTWVQLFHPDEVIYPESVPEMLKMLEKTTLEEAIEFLNEWAPSGKIMAAIRHETISFPKDWSQESYENMRDIKESFKHITNRNRNKKKQS